MIDDLFRDQPPALPEQQRLGRDAWLLRQRVSDHDALAMFTDIQRIVATHPLRHMVTRGGHAMSVATTSCGTYGWVSDAAHGYRYTEQDPATDTPWPPLPARWKQLANTLAAIAGYQHFHPDTALINAYAPGTQMGLHQDRDEASLDWPVVSVSLGLTARFMFGGLKRRDTVVEVPLGHGDVVVWGGVDRLRFHGIRPLREGWHPLTKRWRYNVTFRRVQP